MGYLFRDFDSELRTDEKLTPSDLLTAGGFATQWQSATEGPLRAVRVIAPPTNGRCTRSTRIANARAKVSIDWTSVLCGAFASDIDTCYQRFAYLPGLQTTVQLVIVNEVELLIPLTSIGECRSALSSPASA